ncbi:Tab2/Atab2 family RNA-binding protein [Coleofasciculus sp. H7-2]|uniref:Tab2/Atab2 family RNA-binding protein n=1 Tax=Coleofasciculus sp. H7-2 TaxID=3351545 RepID=UPI00366D65B3
MRIWQADFYRRPLKDEKGQVLWELLICDATRSFSYDAFCPQSEANAIWLISQLQQAAGGNLPNLIQVFRPQSLSLLEAAGKQLGIVVEPTRRTHALKEYLQERLKQYPSLDNYTYTGEPFSPLDKPPPVPLPENLWGEQWRFAKLPAGDLVAAFAERPIPILEMPEFLLPINLGLASTIPVPGVVIYGGRQSMRLARWLQEARPVSLNYIAGAPDGLVLEAGLVDRWIVATFEDKEVRAAAQAYQQRQQQSRGLHFLLVQPDESGMTYSGFWLLGGED